jgi:6-phosphogluconolactonase
VTTYPIFSSFDTPDDLAQEAAQYIEGIINRTVLEKGFASLVLPGGTSPHKTFHYLKDRSIPWEKLHIFMGDERMVPYSHEDSNFGSARKLLLDFVPVKEEQVHPIPPTREGTEEYHLLCEDYFREFGFAFDVVLLGMGPDGHTASLFPDAPSLMEKNYNTFYIPAPPREPKHPRITLTLPVLNESRHIIFIVGEGRGKKIHEILHVHDTQYPASLVRGEESLNWFYVK